MSKEWKEEHWDTSTFLEKVMIIVFPFLLVVFYLIFFYGLYGVIDKIEGMLR